MDSFEKAFSDTEQAAKSTLASARLLMTQARALERAAKNGSVVAMNRARDRLDEAFSALEREVNGASDAWPFEEWEEEDYLSESYANELRVAASKIGLDIYERDGLLVSYPSIVRILPERRAVRVDRKQVSTIRPSHLSDLLLKNRDKKSGYSSSRFLESLYSVYSDITSESVGSGRLTIGGRVVPLARIYKLLTALPGATRDYDRSDFARDLYTLDANGPRETRRGAVVAFPASSGARSPRASDLFTFTGPDGQSVTYFGIRFAENG